MKAGRNCTEIKPQQADCPHPQPSRTSITMLSQAEGVANILSGRGAFISLKDLDGWQRTDTAQPAGLLQGQCKCCTSNSSPRYGNAFACQSSPVVQQISQMPDLTR